MFGLFDKKKQKHGGEKTSVKRETDRLLPPSADGGTVEDESASLSPWADFSDHFSLDAPSDQVRFRTNAVRVYTSGAQQFQIIETIKEETNKERSIGGGAVTSTFKAKVTSDGSSGLSMLRGWYTLVAFLMMGFLLIFCLQVLLFLFVSLVTEGGLSSAQSLNVFHLLGSILSAPIFVYGLASSLTIASEFVSDTWQGHKFFRSVLSLPAVILDWYSFVVFLGLPLCVMLYNLLTSKHWWEPTALTWFFCVTFSFALFCLVVFIFEIWGALEILSHHPDYADDTFHLGTLLNRAIRLRQLHSYCGVRNRTFYIEGSQALPTPNDSYDESENADHEYAEETIGWYSRFTQAMPDTYFFEYDKPKRQFNIEDVLDREVFVTDASWNLEKLFCRRQQARSILVVNGPSSVTGSQFRSSLACSILGNLLMLVFFGAFLYWGGAPIAVVILLVAVVIYCNRGAGRRIFALYDSYKDTRDRHPEGLEHASAGSEIIYQVTETHRVTRPSDKLCWILFGLEMFLLFVFPLWMLFDIGNKAIAILFLILGVFSACRHYFNAPVVLAELGSLDLLDGSLFRPPGADTSRALDLKQQEADWREKNRLSKIVGRISQGPRRDTWMKVIGTFVLIFLFLFLSAFKGGSNSGAEVDTSNLLHDFRYVPEDGSFHYPTCSLTSDFSIPGSNATTLADYAYLAGIAYTAPESMPDVLDAWFGNGIAYDDYDAVTKFRSKLESESAVHYKLIMFKEDPDFAVVTIRGTNNGWDMISDAQLWSASFLAQAVRGLLPFGEIWNPILEELVEFIGVLQSDSLKKVAFYQQTSEFVTYLKEKKIYPSLRITGHSLGGGLAMISGAQTKTPAIGLSGPNTIITRKTLKPPVFIEDLDKYTFNIIPDRDPVPAIDDPAKNTQRIACLADANNFVDCHTSTRSLCDILYTCGSFNRPVLCECALYFGYPEPEPTGGRTFAEACPRSM